MTPWNRFLRAGGVVTPEQEFGRGYDKPRFLEDALERPSGNLSRSDSWQRSGKSSGFSMRRRTSCGEIVDNVLCDADQPPQTFEAGGGVAVSLEQTISGISGRPEKGPYPAGKAEIIPDGRLRISIIDSNAGRHAAGLIRDDMIDVMLWQGSVGLR